MNYLTFTMPPKIGLAVPFGPVTPPQRWYPVRCQAEALSRKADTAPVGYVMHQFAFLWTQFAQTVELELRDRTGTPEDIAPSRRLGQWPKPVWRPFVNRTTPLTEAASTSAAWRWCADALDERV